MKSNYYWSDNWSEEFYIALSKAGFISTSYETKYGLVLLPELQFSYAVLDFKNLHISKKVQKLIDEDNYNLQRNSKFNEVLAMLEKSHKYNWLKNEYVELLQKLYKNNDKRDDFKIISTELICKKSNELVAGEIGYIIANTYTSLSGFSSRERKHNNSGTLQLVLLAKHLEKNNFKFWNFGHPHMEYKKRLGCKVYERSVFLQRWEREVIN